MEIRKYNELCRDAFLDQKLSFLFDELDLLLSITQEIEELTIEQTKNLRTTNLNYVFHMAANYDEKTNNNNVQDLSNEVGTLIQANSCNQQ